MNFWIIKAKVLLLFGENKCENSSHVYNVCEKTESKTIETTIRPDVRRFCAKMLDLVIEERDGKGWKGRGEGTGSEDHRGAHDTTRDSFSRSASISRLEVCLIGSDTSPLVYTHIPDSCHKFESISAKEFPSIVPKVFSLSLFECNGRQDVLLFGQIHFDSLQSHS